jgi:hypothetical protein
MVLDPRAIGHNAYGATSPGNSSLRYAKTGAVDGRAIQSNFDPRELMYNPDSYAYQIQNQYGGDLAAALAGAQGRATPQTQAATIDQSQANQFRNQQKDLTQALADRAAGRGGPSLAEMQMRRGLDTSIASQRAQAASARGLSPGMAQRLAANNIAQAQQATNADATMLRASEQQQAQGMLGNVLAGARGQDLGVAGQQAGFQQQAGLANQQAELQNRAQMDQATQAYIAMGMSREEAQQRALADQDRLRAEQAMQASALAQKTASENARLQQDNRDSFMNIIGGASSTAGAVLGAMSDERVKENVDRENVGKDVTDFLEALDAASYDYKNPEKHGQGRHYSVMAQSAAKTKVGRQFVVETPDGLALDAGKGFGAVLAAQKVLHERIKALEDFGKRKKVA